MKSLLFSLLLASQLVFAEDPNQAGEVLIAKGNIRMFHKDSSALFFLKKGMTVYEGTTIVTYEKSFAKLKLKNKDSMTIGPNSKIVIKISDSKGRSVVNLIKGVVRAHIEKREDDRFHIKTKSAAIGVRGTHFMVSHHPESHRTSLLTFKGKVAMAKMTKDLHNNKDKNKEIQKLSNLLHPKVTHVKPGYFTNIANHHYSPITPVKIHHKQFAYLSLNKTLGVKPLKSNQIKSIKRPKNIEPGHGGYIAVAEGLYFPPVKHKGKVNLIGAVDDRGHYVPPKGHKVHPLKGLVHESDSHSELSDKLKRVMDEQVK